VAAGILQAPFIRNEGSHLEARNFGAIGAILGHEMSHGFDDSGRQYDDKGELREWWSQKTVLHYRNLSSCYTSVFDAYRVLGRCCKKLSRDWDTHASERVLQTPKWGPQRETRQTVREGLNDVWVGGCSASNRLY